MLSVQAQAVAVQNLPPLKRFSGESPDLEEDSFDRWLEIFEERARMARWSEEQKLYQLKMHLERTALQVFRMLPEDSKKAYSEAVGSLKKRFRPVNIEELKGIEFHQKMQTSESIKKLGITLQPLGKKAFPGIGEKEFDRLLKVGFPKKKLNVSENKCHCYGIPNYVVVVQITQKNLVMPLCFQENNETKRNICI